MTDSVDPKARKILFSTYWSPGGWKGERPLSKEDFAFAKWAGVMFEPERVSHDEAVSRAIDAVAAVTQEQVASAFLASLDSRRLDLRSALGSYAVGRHLEKHSFRGSGSCEYCGDFDSQKPHDLSVLNFERLKWGGVRHTYPIYIWLDLLVFKELQVPSVTNADIKIFSSVLDAAVAMPPSARARDLEKGIAGCLRSNKAEREILLQILGYAGVLATREHHGFEASFVPASSRSLPPARKIDWQYPFAWWRGSDGISTRAVEYWFPMVVRSAA